LFFFGRAEVVAGGEIIAGAGENDDADVVVGAGGGEGVVQFLEQSPRLRVFIAWAVEDDPGNAVVLLVENRFVFHGHPRPDSIVAAPAPQRCYIKRRRMGQRLCATDFASPWRLTCKVS